MKTSPTTAAGPVKVGLIADLTGPLSFVGVANANVARMVVDDLNADGGLLGRRLELLVEDSATDDDVAAAKARKLVEVDQVDVVFEVENGRIVDAREHFFDLQAWDEFWS